MMVSYKRYILLLSLGVLCVLHTSAQIEITDTLLFQSSIFPKMRTCSASVVYRDRANQITNTRVIHVRDTVFTHDTVYIAATPLIKHEPDTLPYRRKPVAAFRTNLLLPLLNVGIEIPIGNRWSVGADWYYPWLWRNWHKSTEMKNCFELLLGGVEVRYWFGSKHKPGVNNQKYRLTGHSLGTYAYGGYFDIGKDFSGRQGEFFNVGLDYMYSITLSRRFKMEFSLGIGFIHSSARKYSVYDAGGHAYRNGMIERINWFGPTKATVSLVVPICRKVRKEEPEL